MAWVSPSIDCLIPLRWGNVSLRSLCHAYVCMTVTDRYKGWSSTNAEVLCHSAAICVAPITYL
jgi:hypothetical protein